MRIKIILISLAAGCAALAVGFAAHYYVAPANPVLCYGIPLGLAAFFVTRLDPAALPTAVVGTALPFSAACAYSLYALSVSGNEFVRLRTLDAVLAFTPVCWALVGGLVARRLSGRLSSRPRA